MAKLMSPPLRANKHLLGNASCPTPLFILKKINAPPELELTSTRLAMACQADNASDAAEILAQAPHLARIVDATGSTMFFSAARMASPKCLALLLPFSDPLFQSSDGTTALMHAAVGRSAECMSLLLPVSDPNARTHHGWTALMRCIADAFEPGVDLLLPVTDLSFKGRFLGQLLSAPELSRDPRILARSFSASTKDSDAATRQRILHKLQAELESLLLLSSCRPVSTSRRSGAKAPRL